MASNWQFGSTPKPGMPIQAKDFASLANATTATRETFSNGATGIVTTGGVVFLPPAPYRPPASKSHPFLPYDVSGGGPNGLISVTAGSVTDLTNGGTPWVGTTGPNLIYINDPSAGNVPFALPLAGPPIRQPQLLLDSAATCCYLNATVDPTTGFITAMEIDGDTGSGVPVSTTTNWYSLLSTLAVTITSGVATVKINNDGAQSNLFVKICGVIPLADGSEYNVGT